MPYKRYGPPALTLKEVAERLKLNWATIRELIRQGRLRAFTIGTAIRVEEADLAAFILKQKRTASIRLTEPRYKNKGQSDNKDLPGQEFFDQAGK